MTDVVGWCTSQRDEGTFYFKVAPGSNRDDVTLAAIETKINLRLFRCGIVSRQDPNDWRAEIHLAPADVLFMEEF